MHGAREDARKAPMFPELWRAKVVAMNGDRMLLQGYERVGNEAAPSAPMIKQEWAVQVMAEQQAGLSES